MNTATRVKEAANRMGIPAAEPTEVTRERYAAWQAKQEALDAAEATGAPELVALRKLARTAESIFEFQGIMHRLTPVEILGEALRCAQSDFAVLGDSSETGSGMADEMVFRRAELRIDLALALAEYRAAFPLVPADAAEGEQ